MRHASKKTLIFLLLSGILLLIFKKFDFQIFFSFSHLKTNYLNYKLMVANNPIESSFIYFIVYILIAAFSLPGATILTLTGGALFGLFPGLVLVSFASTLGATLSFFFARFFLKDWVEQKFGSKLTIIQEGVKKNGALYLFSLRLVPVFPFFLINILMGLTSISVLTYYWVSQIGMLAGTAVYVYAGTEIANIKSIDDIVTFKMLLVFSLMGIFPLLAKLFINYLNNKAIYSAFKKPKNFDYNLIVIGGGSAGLVTSYIAAILKSRVALIEKHKMGGDCLNTGCVPSKALIKSAKIAHLIKKSNEFGIDVENSKINFLKVMKRVQDVISKIEPHDSIERYSQLGVECIQGTATITSPYSIEVDGKSITSKSIVIATGAKPFVPPIPGLEEIPYLTSDTIWSLKERPDKLLILGGGPIGCELAQAFSRLGGKIILVEMASRILIREDLEVSDFFHNLFLNDGLDIRCGHKALSFATKNNQYYLTCENQSNQNVEIEFTTLLLAIGRVPNTKNLGLEQLGIKLAKNGTISHDLYLRTNVPNIYVCGDVAGPYQFTHTAAHQAWYTSFNSLFSPLAKLKVDYKVIPWCTFTDPEIARVGINEDEAIKGNIPFDIIKYEMSELDRAIADSENEGFLKILVKPGTDHILGVTIIASHASDMITEFVTAMKYSLGLNKILGTIHIYPTHSEANKYVAGVWKQKNKPKSLLKLLEKFHSWRRNSY